MHARGASVLRGELDSSVRRAAARRATAASSAGQAPHRPRRSVTSRRPAHVEICAGSASSRRRFHGGTAFGQATPSPSTPCRPVAIESGCRGDLGVASLATDIPVYSPFALSSSNSSASSRETDRSSGTVPKDLQRKRVRAASRTDHRCNRVPPRRIVHSPATGPSCSRGRRRRT